MNRLVLKEGINMDFDRLTEVMRRLSLEAGDKIMEIYEGDRKSVV